MLIRNPTNQDPACLWFLHQISNLQAEPEFHRAPEKKLQAVSISSENGWLEDSFPFGARPIFQERLRTVSFRGVFMVEFLPIHLSYRKYELTLSSNTWRTVSIVASTLVPLIERISGVTGVANDRK